MESPMTSRQPFDILLPDKLDPAFFIPVTFLPWIVLQDGALSWLGGRTNRYHWRRYES
jgi:hypothetical protein